MQPESLLLASDMHLDPADSALTERFLARLDAHFSPSDAPTQALILAGDLFEVWVGDDQPDVAADALAHTLARWSQAGAWVGILHGNRDFLLGEAWCQRAQASLLPDPVRIDLGACHIALSHGDQWVTDDDAYQQARRMVRDPAWQGQFLARPLSERMAFAREQRRLSQEHKSTLNDALMDVSAPTIDAVAHALIEQGVHVLIHGHTHRPARHEHGALTRYVLEDWTASDRGSFLRVSAQAVEVVR